jgi:hypothetical protein
VVRIGYEEVKQERNRKAVIPNLELKMLQVIRQHRSLEYRHKYVEE